MDGEGGRIDWAAAAAGVGAGPGSSGSDTAKRIVASLLGGRALRDAVDLYVDGGPGGEHARSVLWLLRPGAAAARARCLEIYRTDPDPERRSCAVELLRVVATAEDLPLVADFLADDDPAVRLWGIKVLDHLAFDDLVDAEEAEPHLRAAERHPDPGVRETAATIRGFFDRG